MGILRLVEAIGFQELEFTFLADRHKIDGHNVDNAHVCACFRDGGHTSLDTIAIYVDLVDKEKRADAVNSGENSKHDSY